MHMAIQALPGDAGRALTGLRVRQTTTVLSSRFTVLICGSITSPAMLSQCAHRRHKASGRTVPSRRAPWQLPTIAQPFGAKTRTTIALKSSSSALR